MALRLQDEPSWKAFLQEADIPDTNSGSSIGDNGTTSCTTEHSRPSSTAEHSPCSTTNRSHTTNTTINTIRQPTCHKYVDAREGPVGTAETTNVQQAWSERDPHRGKEIMNIFPLYISDERERSAFMLVS